jgi:hypothetical protein
VSLPCRPRCCQARTAGQDRAGVVVDPSGDVVFKIDPSLAQRMYLATFPGCWWPRCAAHGVPAARRAGATRSRAQTARQLTVAAKITAFGGRPAVSNIAKWALSAPCSKSARPSSGATLGWLTVELIFAAFADSFARARRRSRSRHGHLMAGG